MKYLELTVTTTSEASELVADKLWEYTGHGVSVADGKDIIDLIENRRQTWDYMDDGVLAGVNSATFVKCYIDLAGAYKVSADIEKSLIDLKNSAKDYFNFGTLEITKRIVDGDDWIEVWRKHYKPIPIKNVVICPEWINYEPKRGERVVRIDSNMAFGTGEHETTSMCVEFLCDLIKGGEKVVDVGTGSGILGITALILGAKSAVMTDIDPVAVQTAKRNAELNGVKGRALITLDNLIDKSEGVGDIVVANITADVLSVLVGDLKNHVNAGGKVILSGILREKAENLNALYVKNGYKTLKSTAKGEWVAFLMERL